MIRTLFCAIGVSFSLLNVALAVDTSVDAPFTPLHVYYVAPNGNDGCSGTNPAISTSGNCAWKTLNHAGIVCGDVILAGPGSYTQGFNFGQWGTVTGCPSTTGGIDGKGGINFAVFLCAGTDVMSCQINTPALDPIRPSVGHWAIEGFWASQGPGPTHPGSSEQTGCFTGDNQGGLGPNPQPYLAFINNIASVCNLSGFTSGGGGCDPYLNGCSFDYIAVIGSVSFNGANSLTGGNGYFCGSGVSMFPGSPFNTYETHIYVSQYFGAYNTNATGTGAGNECDAAFRGGTFPHTDGEGLIMDTYGSGYARAGAFNKPSVLENSVMWHSGNSCIEFFPQGDGLTSDQAQYYVSNVTCYANSQDPRAGCGGEVWGNGIYPSGTARYQIRNSIFFGTQIKCGGTGDIDVPGVVQLSANGAQVCGASGCGNNPNALILSTSRFDISGNWVWQSHAPTINVVGPPNTYVVDNTSQFGTPPCSASDPRFAPPCFDQTWRFGTNTYGDPGMASPATLFSTTPNCAGFISVVDCMNTGLGVYAKITPTIAPTTVGYRPPGPCTPNARYPNWLKGIVYLRASGFTTSPTIVMKPGLTTKPCGM